MAGHSKWANIKHRKGRQDAKRGKIFTKLIKELTIAARLGGSDSDSNPRLRTAIANAKRPDKIIGPKTSRKKTPTPTRKGKLLPPIEPRNWLAD